MVPGDGQARRGECTQLDRLATLSQSEIYRTLQTPSLGHTPIDRSVETVHSLEHMLGDNYWYLLKHLLSVEAPVHCSTSIETHIENDILAEFSLTDLVTQLYTHFV